MRLLCANLMLLALLMQGCRRTQADQQQVFHMGDRVQAGGLIYNVLEAAWKSQLGEPPDTRVPKHRFLILRLTVTNSGGRPVMVPQLTLEDGRGQSYPEETKGDGVTQWLGLLRKLDPASTDDGRVLFDVPPGAYRLRVSDDVEFSDTQEKTALVEIPFNIEPDVAVPSSK